MYSSYLYLRTKLSLKSQWDRPVEKFMKRVPMDNVESFNFPPFELLHFRWSNSLVLRFKARPNLKSFYTNAKSELELFDSWALIDDDGSCFESPTGPFSSFMAECRGRPIVKIFALGDADRFERAFGRIEEILSCPTRRVFYDHNGRVMFAQSDMVASMVKRKCEAALCHLGQYVIADAEQNSEPKLGAWISMQRQNVAPYIYGPSAHRYDPAPILIGT
jgi:hypothetical protein